MQRTKIFLIILIGALFAGGLLFFLRPKPDIESMALKPSQLDFSKGNNLPKSKPIVAPVQTAKVQVFAARELPDADRKKIATLQEIVNSKNDNDPRIDSELKNLSPDLKSNLREIYTQFPMESRNNRGLVAFLISRELNSVQDAQFLQQIFQEAPCLSLSDCTSLAESNPHMDGINQTSLNYPQLASLYQLQKRLESQPNLLQRPELKAEIGKILREARQFPASAVQDRAEAIQKKFGL